MASGSVGVLLGSQMMPFNPSERFPIFIDVDYTRFLGQAEALSESLMMLQLSDGQLVPFLAALKDGNSVAVYDYRHEEPITIHSLRGSAAAIIKLGDCILSLDQPQPAPAPPAPQADAPVAAAPPIEPSPTSPSLRDLATTPLPPKPPAPGWGQTASGRVSWGVYDTDDTRAWIRIAGEMTQEVSDDFERLAAEVKNRYPGYDAVDVLLSSNGGQMVAGISIGEEARRLGYSTVAEGVCASSCALAWLGGARLGIEKMAGLVGFHQTYDRDSGAADPQANALVGSYVAKLGYGYDVTIFATEAGPDGMRWLREDDATRLGLPVYWFGAR